MSCLMIARNLDFLFISSLTCYLDIKRSKPVTPFIWSEVVLSYSKTALFWYPLPIDTEDSLFSLEQWYKLLQEDTLFFVNKN